MCQTCRTLQETIEVQYPVQVSKCEMLRMIFTARKRSLQRLCFYTCLSFCSQGGLPHCMLRYHTPGADTPQEADPPVADTPPPPEQTPPTPGADTPPCAVHAWRYGPTSGRYASYWNAILLFFAGADKPVLISEDTCTCYRISSDFIFANETTWRKNADNRTSVNYITRLDSAFMK